jgi:hypothetical protein
MTLLEHAIRLLAWRWKDLFALREDAGRLIAGREERLEYFFAPPQGGHIFDPAAEQGLLGSLAPVLVFYIQHQRRTDNN